MSLLKGTHGTSRSCASLIEKTGFQIGGRGGRGGSGVYFWSYRTNDSIAKELAGYWHQDQLNANRYVLDGDKSCAIIFVELTVKDGEYLDLTDDDIKARFVTYSRHVLRHTRGYPRKRALTRVYDLFVKHIEKLMDVSISVVRVNLPPPGSYTVSIGIVGAPGCYIVKEPSVISIDRIEGC